MYEELARKLLLPGAIFDELVLLEKFRQVCGQQKISMLRFKCSCSRIFDRKLQTFQRHLKSAVYMDCGQCGLSDRYTAEYKAWQSMKDRCYNPNNPRYGRYGGRGITVCQRWRISFRNFLEDMGIKTNDTYSLDRINNDGNYGPGNCRWASSYEQNRNREYYP